MEVERCVIWNSAPDFTDWEDDLRAEYPDANEDELYQIMTETNDSYLDDERANLRDICIPNDICCVGNIGTWRGCFTGYPRQMLKSIPDCLRSFCDSDSTLTIYIDKRGELRSTEAHHDGVNTYWFRAFKPDVSEAQKQRLWSLIYNRQPYENFLRRITFRLGDLIGDVYGLTFPHRPKAAAKVTA